MKSTRDLRIFNQPMAFDLELCDVRTAKFDGLAAAWKTGDNSVC